MQVVLVDASGVFLDYRPAPFSTRRRAFGSFPVNVHVLVFMGVYVFISRSAIAGLCDSCSDLKYDFLLFGEDAEALSS